MGRVRVFYGHEGVVPPTGYRARSAAATAPVADAEADEVVIDSLEGEPVELVGELVEDGEAVPAGSLTRVDGSTDVEVGEDGIPVLSEADAVDEAPQADVDAAPAEHVEGEASGLPDEEWTGSELDAFAEENGIDLTGAKKTKGDKLARILETLKEK